MRKLQIYSFIHTYGSKASSGARKTAVLQELMFFAILLSLKNVFLQFYSLDQSLHLRKKSRPTHR